MKINRLDHVAIVCFDVEVSKNWYCSVLGMEWVYQEKWNGRPIFLQKGDSYIALFQKVESVEMKKVHGPRVDHFAFRAETFNDYESIKAELREKQIKFTEEDHEISHSIYLKDPDQITVEITTYDLA